MKPPNNTKEVSTFIGIVKYYRDMWSKWSHLLYSLTALTSHKVKFKCTDVEQKLFDDIKCAVYKEELLAYPDSNKLSSILTDASDYQIGSVISQIRKLISFHSRKLV